MPEYRIGAAVSGNYSTRIGVSFGYVLLLIGRISLKLLRA